MRLLHILGFTKELVLGSSTSVPILNLFFLCFLVGYRFLKNQEIVCHALEAFSRGCILLELEMISFPIIVFFL